MLLWLVGVAAAEDLKLEQRLLGPGPVTATIAAPPAPAIPWALFGILGVGAAATWIGREKWLAAHVDDLDTAVRVLGRAPLGDGTSVALVEIESGAEKRVLVLGCSNGSPTLLTEIFEEVV